MFTIIIPVHNGEKYISKCIDSVLCAGNFANEFLQIIVVDDASTDNTSKLLDKYINNKQIQIITNNRNGGVSYSRNIALNFATGNYIWFIDGDDFIELSAIKKLRKVIVEFSSDIIFFGWHKFYQEVKFNNEKSKKNVCELTSVDVYKKIINHDMENFCWDMIINKTILTENKLRFPNKVTLLEDMLFVWKAVSYAKKIISIDDKLYGYRMHSDSCSASMDYKKDIDACRMVMRLRYFLKNKYPSLRNEFSSYMLTVLIPRYFAYFNNCKYSIIIKKYIKKYIGISVLYSPKLNNKIKIQYLLMKFNIERIILLWRRVIGKC